MQKRIPFLTLAAIVAISFLYSCRKDAVAASRNMITLFIYQRGTNTPVEGVTIDLYKSPSACTDLFHGCRQIFYQSITTGVNGSFMADEQTTQIDFYKVGYLGHFGSQNGGNFYGPLYQSARYYLDKPGWATFHISNPDAKKIDTILAVPYARLVPKLVIGNDTIFAPSTDSAAYLKINKNTDTIINSVALAGTENYIYLQYQSPNKEVLESLTDSFYVKDGDTAHVNINIK